MLRAWQGSVEDKEQVQGNDGLGGPVVVVVMVVVVVVVVAS